MKAGFKVETRRCDFWDKFLVVANYSFVNLIVNYPMICYPKKNRCREDVGMWRIKNLKR